MALQQELRQQIEFTQTVIETMIDGVAVCHAIEQPPHVGFTIWNPAMQELTGYNMAEINRLGWYQTVYRDPAVQERARQRMERMRGGDNLMREEWVITRKDGTQRTVEISTRVVPHGAGGPHVMAVMRDVTAHKRNDSDIQAARGQLAATLDAIPDLLFEVDLEGRYLDFHSPRADLLAAPAATLLGKTIAEVLPAAAAEVCRAALDEADATGRSHGRQFELPLPQGLCWFELSIARKPQTSVTGPRFIVISRDITERKHVEQALQEREMQLARILESTADGILAVDRVGRVLRTNRRFAELWRIPPELVERGDDAALLAHVVGQLADPQAFLDKVRSLYESSAELTDTVDFRDGRIFERFTAPLVMHNDAVGRIWSFRDITATRRAEQDLRVHEERLRLAMEATHQGWFDVNVQTGEVTVSAEYARILGYEPAEFKSNLQHWIDSVHPDDRENLLKAFAESLKSGVSGQMEYRRRAKSGEWKWIRSIGRIVEYDAGGKPLRMTGTHADISEQRATEAALVDSYHLLHTVVDTAPVRVFWKDLNLNYLGCNPAFARDAGKSSPEELIGKSDFDMGWREQAALYRADDQKVIESGVAKIAYEEPQTAPDGRKIWLRTSKVPFRDHHGNVIGVLGVYEDFTAYKENAEALQQSEARSRELAAVLRNMCDNVPDMIWMKDLSKRYVFANRAMSSDLLGATDADEPVGKTDLYFALRERAAHPDDPEWHTFGELCQDSDDVTLKNDRPSVFEEFGNVKGRYICLDVHKAPFRNANGEVVGIVGSARDVTERQRISRELEQYRMGLEELVQQRTAELVATEARASHILQSSADGLIGLDRAGLITFINTAACSMFGYTPEQAIGRSAHLLLHGRKPDGSPYPEKECPGNAVLTSGQPQRIDNEIFWHADGHGIPVMYALHPMIKDGEHAGTVISVVDMTAQRAAAQAREEALAAAENLARVRREFLANMSHEIRTPLNGVLGFAQIGMRNASQPEKAHNAFEKIITSGNVLLGVINDILDFSKIDAGKIVIEQTDVDLSMLLEEVIDLVGARARGKQIELRLDKAADFPRTCKGDALRLRQVLLNLLSNSVKFTEAGTVTLSASLRQGQLVFSVTDTGIGMSGEQIGKLFTPFQQGDGSTTRKFGGTGLGLAISKGLVDLMGGEIRVESRLGAGSTFEVLLPFVPVNPVARSPAPAVAGAAAAGQSLAGVSILVAEDDAFNRMLLEETLKADDGAQLRVVENGLEAVAAVEREGAGAFDIVLMDLQMPEMDGYEATRRILAIAPGLPIIGQTAHALADDRKKCLAAGMVDHIAKPINLAQLVALIQRHALRRPRNS